MENTYHIVLHDRRGNAETSVKTLDSLRQLGWQPNGDNRHITDLFIDEDTGKNIEGFFDGWNANGDEAWVSRDVYPSSLRVKGRQK